MDHVVLRLTDSFQLLRWHLVLQTSSLGNSIRIFRQLRSDCNELHHTLRKNKDYEVGGTRKKKKEDVVVAVRLMAGMYNCSGI